MEKSWNLGEERNRRTFIVPAGAKALDWSNHLLPVEPLPTTAAGFVFCLELARHSTSPLAYIYPNFSCHAAAWLDFYCVVCNLTYRNPEESSCGFGGLQLIRGRLQEMWQFHQSKHQQSLKNHSMPTTTTTATA